MSEYQYYEFRTVNRQLTAAQRKTVDALSSHGHTTATSFSVDYSWSSFGHNTDEVLARYFDAFFYIANWGTIELKFCYPKEIIDLRTLEPYRVDEEGMVIDYKVIGERVIVSFERNWEEGFGWVENDGALDGLLELYEQILQGDRRVFYLAWLAAAETCSEYSETLTEETLEPSIPPGLTKLSPALNAFVDLFEVGRNLVTVAAKGSEQAQSSTSDAVYEALETLPKAECVDFLHRFLAGEPHLAMKLKKHLDLLQPSSVDHPTGTRTIGELLASVEAIEEQKKRAAAAAQEAQRRAELAALAKRADAAWQEVDDLIGEKKRDSYREAAKLLAKLGELADAQGQSDLFEQRIESIRAKYSRQYALIDELKHI